MAEHTSGPWEVHAGTDNTGYPCYFIHGFSGDQKRDSHMHAANARLLAAAPELLDALKECAELLDDYSDVNDGDDGHPRPNRAMSLLQTVEAVIAKAEAR